MALNDHTVPKDHFMTIIFLIANIRRWLLNPEAIKECLLKNSCQTSSFECISRKNNEMQNVMDKTIEYFRRRMPFPLINGLKNACLVHFL